MKKAAAVLFRFQRGIDKMQILDEEKRLKTFMSVRRCAF